MDFISILICALAVIGLFYLLSRLLGGLVGQHYTVGIRASDYDDAYDLLCAWHAAQLSSITAKEASGTPVVLFEGAMNMRTLQLLREQGIPVYHKLSE